MPGIVDSDAFLDEDRLLAQHQAVITVIQGILAAPDLASFSWLDLACGRGQILVHLKSILTDRARAKIRYYGYDLQAEFARSTERRAQALALAHVDLQIGDLAHFSRLYGREIEFDFVTLTNTVHEIAPTQIASMLFDAVARLSASGRLFVYDMEQIEPPELGAVPWTKLEISEILREFLTCLGAHEYDPGAGLWRHKSTNGWNVQLERRYIPGSPTELIAKREAVVSATATLIGDVLRRKQKSCEALLESLTKYGAETAQEISEKHRLLYDYWALTRAVRAC